MSKYVKYNECEVKINDENIFALNASLSARSNSDANILYGGAVDSYSSAVESQAEVSFEYYITGEIDNIRTLTGDISCSGEFGGIKFSGAYLNNYSVTIRPYLPISFNASFAIFSGYQDTLSTGSFTSDSLELANGAHTSLTNITSSNVGMDNPQEINYSINCLRQGNYVIGEEFPQDVRFGSVEKKLSLKGEDIGPLINFSGKDFAKISIQPRTHNNTSRGQLIECEGIINSQSLNVSKNGMVNGDIEIIERVR